MIIMYFAMTIVVFFTLRHLLSSISSPFANPLLWSIVFIIALLSLTSLDAETYQHANQNLLWLLEPAVVALAIPLFSQIQQLKIHLFSIILCCFLGVVIAMTSGTLIAFAMVDDTQLLLSLLAKSVTSPIAMEISDQINGLVALTAGVVIIVGLSGAVIGQYFLTLFKISNQQAQGLAMGASAHAIGTASAMNMGQVQGAFSTIALVICGIFTAVLSPLFAWLIVTFLS